MTDSLNNKELVAVGHELAKALSTDTPIIGQRTGKNDKTHWISFVKDGEQQQKSDPQLRYATKRIVELESLLLVDVSETVWPAEVGRVFGQIERAGDLPVHHQRRLKHNIKGMWREKMLESDTVLAASESGPMVSAYYWGEC